MSTYTKAKGKVKCTLPSWQVPSWLALGIIILEHMSIWSASWVSLAAPCSVCSEETHPSMTPCLPVSSASTSRSSIHLSAQHAHAMYVRVHPSIYTSTHNVLSFHAPAHALLGGRRVRPSRVRWHPLEWMTSIRSSERQASWFGAFNGVIPKSK